MFRVNSLCSFMHTVNKIIKIKTPYSSLSSNYYRDISNSDFALLLLCIPANHLQEKTGRFDEKSERCY